MATSPVPQWAREMSPDHRGPTGAGVLRLALVAVLVVLLLQFAGATDRGQATSVDRGSMCDQHRADPAWTSVCQEVKRGH
jgi:hypothetical protein